MVHTYLFDSTPPFCTVVHAKRGGGRGGGGGVSMFRAICQLRNCAVQILNFQFAQLFTNCTNCARCIVQFVNSDLRLIPRPRTYTCSLAAITQLGWKLHYSPAAVIQPLISLRRSRSRILQCLTALINYARQFSTVVGLSQRRQRLALLNGTTVEAIRGQSAAKVTKPCLNVVLIKAYDSLRSYQA